MFARCYSIAVLTWLSAAVVLTSISPALSAQPVIGANNLGLSGTDVPATLQFSGYYSTWFNPATGGCLQTPSLPRPAAGPPVASTLYVSSWLSYFGNTGNRPPACFQNGELTVNAPGYYQGTASGTVSSFRVPLGNGVILGYKLEGTSDHPVTPGPGDCSPPFTERTIKRQTVHRFDVRSGRQSVSQTTHFQRIWNNIIFDDLIQTQTQNGTSPITYETWPYGTCGNGPSFHNRDSLEPIAAVASLAAPVRVRWVAAQANPAPSLRIYDSLGAQQSFSSQYLGFESQGQMVVHQWDVIVPQLVGTTPRVLVFSAQQGAATSVESRLTWFASPVLLVHGLWSEASAMLPLTQYLNLTYPAAPEVAVVDLFPLNDIAFSDPRVQQQVWLAAKGLIERQKVKGISTDSIDFVGHSMGGLAAIKLRQLHPEIRVRTIVTIGTPMLGSRLAAWLLEHGSTSVIDCNAIPPGQASGLVRLACLGAAGSGSSVTIKSLFELADKRFGSALTALSPGSSALSSIYPDILAGGIQSIAGTSVNSGIEAAFPALATMAGVNMTLDEVFQTAQHDGIVSVPSQLAVGWHSTHAAHIHSALPIFPDPFGNSPELDSQSVNSAVRSALSGVVQQAEKGKSNKQAQLGGNGLDELYTNVLDGRTQYATSWEQIVSAPNLVQFRSGTVSLVAPTACPAEKAWFFHQDLGIAFDNSAPITFDLVPKVAGTTRASALILCGGNRFIAIGGPVSALQGSSSVRFSWDGPVLIAPQNAGTYVAVEAAAGSVFYPLPNAVVTSSAPSVATYDSVNRMVMGHTRGQATLTVTFGSSTASLVVYVFENSPSSLLFQHGFE